MKQIYFRTTASSQNLQGMGDAFCPTYTLNYWMKMLRNIALLTTFANEPKKLRGINIFLNQNKGNAPPGQARSPGLIAPNWVTKPVRFLIPINTEQTLINKLKLNFLQTFKFSLS